MDGERVYKFDVGPIPRRTKVEVRLNLVTGQAEIERYVCLDCPFKTLSLEEMQAHQQHQTLGHRLKRSLHMMIRR